ncbi:MAG: cupin domain-containing protein [Chloroflexi bacterium]|nr:cupin domain-containing protein [Chloroflexota bacterium]
MTFYREAVVLESGEGKTISWPGTQMTFKVKSEDTSGYYALIEGVAEPGTSPPLHIHRDSEEAYYVLEGEFTVRIGDSVLDANRGTFILIPRGVAHSFANTGAGPGRLLIMVSPAGLEGYFQEFAETYRDSGRLPDAGLAHALAEKYASEVIGPPLGQH